MNSTSSYAITIHSAVDGSILAPFHPFIRERIKAHANHTCKYAQWLENSRYIFCVPPTDQTSLRPFLWPVAESIAAVLFAQWLIENSINSYVGIAPFQPENVPTAEKDNKELDAELATEFELWLFNNQILRTGRAITLHESRSS